MFLMIFALTLDNSCKEANLQFVRVVKEASALKLVFFIDGGYISLFFTLEAIGRGGNKIYKAEIQKGPGFEGKLNLMLFNPET